MKIAHRIVRISSLTAPAVGVPQRIATLAVAALSLVCAASLVAGCTGSSEPSDDVGADAADTAADTVDTDVAVDTSDVSVDAVTDTDVSDTADADAGDLCEGLTLCAERGAICDDDILTRCVADENGCLVEVRFDCTSSGGLCEETGVGQAVCARNDACIGRILCDEPGTYCGGNFLYVCGPDEDGCLVENEVFCPDFGFVCRGDIDPAGCYAACEQIDECVGETACDGETLVNCGVSDNGCLVEEDRVDCAATGDRCLDELTRSRCVGADYCDAAIPLNCDSEPFEVSTGTGGARYGGYPLCDPDSVDLYYGREALFRFTEDRVTEVTATFTWQGDADFDAFLLDDASGTCAGDEACLDHVASIGGRSETLTFEAGPDASRLLVVDVFDGFESDTVEVTISCTGDECGDGSLDPGETCDDRNDEAGDGCDACQVELGWACTGSSNQTCHETECGDGVVEGAEACDPAADGHAIACNAQCEVAEGFACHPNDGCHAIECGDGYVDADEACDDGNDAAGDGCAACVVEAGSTCVGQPSACYLDAADAGTCTNPIVIGDGTYALDSRDFPSQLLRYDCVFSSSYDASETVFSVVVPPRTALRASLTHPTFDGRIILVRECGATTDCDSSSISAVNHTNNTDEAAPFLLVVDGDEAGPFLLDVSLTGIVCGDSIRATTESCDDGNARDGDGCSSLCAIESGFACMGLPSVCELRQCGDGLDLSGEDCDDGNQADLDGCSAICEVEEGWVCDTLPSPNICTEVVCGDGAVEGAEACDDGNSDVTDGCVDCSVDPAFFCAGEPSVCGARLTGDLCTTAVRIGEGTIASSTTGFANDYDDYAGECAGFGRRGAGPDSVYIIEVPAGATLEALLDGLSFDETIAIAGACDDLADSCLNYADDPGLAVWRNSGDADVDVYIVVDGFGSSAAGSYTLTTTFSEGGGEIGTLPGDTCGSAERFGGSPTIEYDTTAYANDYSTYSSTLCPYVSASGPDAAFGIRVPPMQRVSVTASAPYDVVVVLVSNCLDPRSSCVAIADNVNAIGAETAVWDNTDVRAVDITIIVDGDVSGDAGPGTINVSFTDIPDPEGG